MAHRLLYII